MCHVPGRPSRGRSPFSRATYLCPARRRICGYGSRPARLRRLSHLRQAHRQKFLEGWGAGRENLFPKRFPSPQSFSSLQIFISCLRSCPARKIPPEKRLPPFETTVWGAPRSSSPPGAASCRERRDIRGRRSAGGSSAARSSSPTKKIPGGPGTKKDPLALKAARGSRTIFGSGLLSHMTLCSIIGDGELNFRVRNGVGCTLSSMATKEISGHLFESGCVTRLRALGHGCLCPLPALPAGAPCHIRTSAPKCGNTTEMPLSKY